MGGPESWIPKSDPHDGESSVTDMQAWREAHSKKVVVPPQDVLEALGFTEEAIRGEDGFYFDKDKRPEA